MKIKEYFPIISFLLLISQSYAQEKIMNFMVILGYTHLNGFSFTKQVSMGILLVV